jgi:putative hydrolase of the HAD superfamily
MTRWILVDYGEVISVPQSTETIVELASLAGQEPDEFRERYWRFRLPYDLGQSDDAYWSEVLDRDLSTETDLVEEMVRVDVAGWMTLNPQTLPTLLEFANEADARLALLSNAPESLAIAIDASGWSSNVVRRVFSCRLELAKPNIEVFEAVLGELGAAPQSVLFIDDRTENTQAAATLGIQTARFTSVEELAHLLDDWESEMR